MVSRFNEVKKILNNLGLIEKDKRNLEERLKIVFKHNKISDIFQLYLPKVDDLSSLLNLSSGKVYALRMDKTPSTNHKHHVVAGLILRNILLEKLTNQDQILIDGGNVNNAKALTFHSENLGLKARYVMSRLFPLDIINNLKSENFEILQAPEDKSKDIEKEFYEFAFSLYKQNKNDYVFLAHAVYGFEVMRYFGRRIAEALKKTNFIDCSVSCIGAGTTLEAIQLPIKYLLDSEIYIGEHELSPIFSKSFPFLKSKSFVDCDEISNIRTVSELPHSVIGPHYDEQNPFISKLEHVSKVITYSESDWKKMKNYLLKKGLSIGNSSSANLHLAKFLAEEYNKNVFTIIFEPDRDFYYK